MAAAGLVFNTGGYTLKGPNAPSVLSLGAGGILLNSTASATGTNLGRRVSEGLKRDFPASPSPRVKIVEPARLAVTEDSAVNAVVRKEAYGFLVLDSNTVANRSVRYAGRNASSVSDVASYGSRPEISW